MLFTLLSIGIKDKPGIHENSHTVIVRPDCTAMLIDRCYLNMASQNLLTHTHTHTHTHTNTRSNVDVWRLESPATGEMFLTQAVVYQLLDSIRQLHQLGKLLL